MPSPNLMRPSPHPMRSHTYATSLQSWRDVDALESSIGRENGDLWRFVARIRTKTSSRLRARGILSLTAWRAAAYWRRWFRHARQVQKRT
jgi:hypothetical protein